ncbi:ATP-binding protein [Streptomyces megasporus]|uniref:ATP-binding protein n=1 Tax=Streptomyces megasporus TaxID=44060 RepID=UPI000689A238|nr:ATP-binding protein [Streptomyces megasporus]
MEARSAVHRVESRLPRSGDSAARARDLTRELLDGCAYRGRFEDVVLVVSELTSNALRHGCGAPTLRLEGDARRIRVEVSDGSPAFPEPRTPGPDGGWGLTLVARLAAAWGVSGRGSGKTVWCEMVFDEAPSDSGREHRDRGQRRIGSAPGLAM